MRFEQFSFGLIRIDGVTYERAAVVDRGEVRKRKKKHIPLANVDNLSVKPLIEEMTTGLSPRTVNKYVEHVKQFV